MLVKEIIQRVQSLYSKGVQSDDSRLTPRHIYNSLLTTRATLLTQSMNKRQKLSQWNFQTLSFVELVPAKINECEMFENIGCTILRSKYPLPKPLTGFNEHLIQSVLSFDGKTSYDEVAERNVKNIPANKYTATRPRYFIRNGYMYITSNKNAHIIFITGLFENPWEVKKYPKLCISEDCDECDECSSPLDMEFPLDASKLSAAILMVANELISIFSGVEEDLNNDSTDGRSSTRVEIPQQQKTNAKTQS